MTPEQPSLFDDGVRVYAGKVGSQDTATSKAAAAVIDMKLGKLQRQVLTALFHNPTGFTDEEIDMYWMVDSPLRPRRVELMRAGYVADSKTVRKGRRGLLMSVWTLTEKGRKAAEELLS